MTGLPLCKCWEPCSCKSISCKRTSLRTACDSSIPAGGPNCGLSERARIACANNTSQSGTAVQNSYFLGTNRGVGRGIIGVCSSHAQMSLLQHFSPAPGVCIIDLPPALNSRQGWVESCPGTGNMWHPTWLVDYFIFLILWLLVNLLFWGLIFGCCCKDCARCSN